MSLRQTAKILGISPAYLSYMINGKRPWRPDLHERYLQLVNTVGLVNTVNTLPQTVNNLRVSMEAREPVHYATEGSGPAGIRTQDTRIKSPML